MARSLCSAAILLLLLGDATASRAEEPTRLILTLGKGPASAAEAARASSLERVPKNRMVEVVMTVAGPAVAKVAPPAIKDYGLQLTLEDQSGGNEASERTITRAWSLREQAGQALFSVPWRELSKTHYFRKWSGKLKDGGEIAVKIVAVELHPTGNFRQDGDRMVAEQEWRSAGAPLVSGTLRVEPFDVAIPGNDRVVEALGQQFASVVAQFPNLPQGDSGSFASAYSSSFDRYVRAKLPVRDLDSWSYKDAQVSKPGIAFASAAVQEAPSCSFGDEPGTMVCTWTVSAHVQGQFVYRNKPGYLQRQLGVKPDLQRGQAELDCSWRAVFAFDGKGQLAADDLDWYGASCEP